MDRAYNRDNEFIVNILDWVISRKMAVGRPWLQYLKQVARNTAADSYTAMKTMAWNKSRWKAANQSKDWRIRRRKKKKKLCYLSSETVGFIWIELHIGGSLLHMCWTVQNFMKIDATKVTLYIADPVQIH
jgi:hypothetical protein